MTTPLDITRVLLHYGAEEVPDSGGWQRMKCCFHEDETASGRVNITEGAFACMACGVKGDTISLIKLKERVEYVGAVEFYERLTGTEVPRVRRPAQGKPGRTIFGKPRDYDSGGGLFSGWLHG